jgi:hypothetical protein
VGVSEVLRTHESGDENDGEGWGLLTPHLRQQTNGSGAAGSPYRGPRPRTRGLVRGRGLHLCQHQLRERRLSRMTSRTAKTADCGMPPCGTRWICSDFSESLTKPEAFLREGIVTLHRSSRLTPGSAWLFFMFFCAVRENGDENDSEGAARFQKLKVGRSVSCGAPCVAGGLCGGCMRCSGSAA